MLAVKAAEHPPHDKSKTFGSRSAVAEPFPTLGIRKDELQ